MRILIIIGALTLAAGCTRPRRGPGTRPLPSAAPSPSLQSSQAVQVEPPPDLDIGCWRGQHDVAPWKRIDPSTVPPGRRTALNGSRCTWAVSILNDVVIAEEHRNSKPDVPPEFVVPKLGAPRVVRHGRAGILLGYDRGEWGGALRWHANDRTFKKQLLDDNILDVLPMTQGFLAVSDLVGLDTGRATELIDSGTVYRLGRSAEISSVPCAVVAESEGTFLIATMSGLIRLTREFHMQRVFRAEWALYYPVSLVVKDRRIAYVGMRGIVVEVDLAAVPAKETWLSPVDLKYPYLK